VAIAVGSTALAAATLLRYSNDIVNRNASIEALRSTPGWLRVLATVACATCVAAIWMTTSRPSIGMGLALLLMGWLVPTWADSSTLAPHVRVAAESAWPMVVTGVAVVALLWHRPMPRYTWTALTMISAVASSATLVAGLGRNPFEDPRCSEICREVSAPLHRVISTPQALIITGFLSASAGLGLLAALVRVRPKPLAIAAAAAATAPVMVALRALDGEHEAITVETTVTAVGVASVAAAIIWTRMRLIRTRRAVDRLAADLVAGGNLDDAQFSAPGELAWLDSAGREVPTSDEHRHWLALEDPGGDPAIRLAVGTKSQAEWNRDQISAATRLALENARLAAIGRARMRAVRESQQRIVATFDIERGHLERDLHDGAQQRLVSVAFLLSAARTAGAETSRAQDHVRDALDALRRIAHGVFPSALTLDGITAAIEDLIAAGDVLVRLDIDPGLVEPVDRQAATAVYEVVAFVLLSSEADIDLLISRDAVGVRIQAHVSRARPAPDRELSGVRDRVGAAGGSFDLRPGRAGELDVEAVVPCASS
jgi:signal transduction histidine kinase